MFYLWKEDGLNQQELANIANKEKSTITRQVNNLEKKGLIYRENGRSDKRNKQIFLTAKGKQMEVATLEIAYDITQLSEAGVRQDDLEIFRKVLHLVILNLQKL